jgi:hypothetical protein
MKVALVVGAAPVTGGWAYGDLFAIALVAKLVCASEHVRTGNRREVDVTFVIVGFALASFT